ncbi:MAG TPA: hypothetical protein PK977_12125, partial [Chitinophagaceae bacterium]|nr:hypothetical protein [Chitinophagaceae bacterium]
MKPLINHILSKLIALIAVCFFVNNLQAQVPTANFSGTPLSGCSPLIVHFQDLSTGNPTAWNWNFGNGNTSVL